MKIIIALALIAPVFVIIVARRPGGFRIARSITISAPPSAAFDQVNDCTGGRKYRLTQRWIRQRSTLSTDHATAPAPASRGLATTR